MWPFIFFYCLCFLRSTADVKLTAPIDSAMSAPQIENTTLAEMLSIRIRSITLLKWTQKFVAPHIFSFPLFCCLCALTAVPQEKDLVRKTAIGTYVPPPQPASFENNLTLLFILNLFVSSEFICVKNNPPGTLFMCVKLCASETKREKERGRERICAYARLLLPALFHDIACLLYWPPLEVHSN